MWAVHGKDDGLLLGLWDGVHACVSEAPDLPRAKTCKDAHFHLVTFDLRSYRLLLGREELMDILQVRFVELNLFGNHASCDKHCVASTPTCRKTQRQ